ncbi:hypothetical protein Lumi_080 [Xylophilus phage Lumi]|nr:hypothetical protein Lumi_080 [Xylophilus phage Lumi]
MKLLEDYMSRQHSIACQLNPNTPAFESWLARLAKMHKEDGYEEATVLKSYREGKYGDDLGQGANPAPKKPNPNSTSMLFTKLQEDGKIIPGDEADVQDRGVCVVLRVVDAMSLEMGVKHDLSQTFILSGLNVPGRVLTQTQPPTPPQPSTEVPFQPRTSPPSASMAPPAPAVDPDPKGVTDVEVK